MCKELPKLRVIEHDLPLAALLVFLHTFVDRVREQQPLISRTRCLDLFEQEQRNISRRLAHGCAIIQN